MADLNSIISKSNWNIDPTQPINRTTTDSLGPRITKTQDAVYQNGPGGQNPDSKSTGLDAEIVKTDIDMSPNGPGGQNPDSKDTGLDSRIETPDIILDPTKPIHPGDNVPTDGTYVYFKYDSTLNACEQIKSLAKKIKDSLDEIQSIVDGRDKMWRGEAGDRFWQQLEAKGKEYSLENIKSIVSELIPKATTSVEKLVEQNKQVDSKLMSETFTSIKANDNVNATTADTNAQGVNEEGINTVVINDNINSNEANINAQGVNQGLINETHANDNVRENSVTTDAYGVNTNTINEVHTDGKINSNAAAVNTGGVDKELLESITTSGAFDSGTTAAMPGENSDKALADIMSAFLESRK